MERVGRHEKVERLFATYDGRVSRYFLFAASKGTLVSGTKTRGAGNDLPRLPGRRGHLIVEQNYPLEISSSAESAPNAALQR